MPHILSQYREIPSVMAIASRLPSQYCRRESHPFEQFDSSRDAFAGTCQSGLIKQ
jgi:hypothetical protein